MGYEGLNLFKWSSIAGDKLLAVLESGLEDYDRLSDHILVLNTSGEYDLINEKYNVETHTFVKSDQSNSSFEAQLLRKMVARQSLLKRKFLSEISKGAGKCYVFRSVKEMHPNNIKQISDALFNLGASKFLLVQPYETLAKEQLVFEVKNQIAFGRVEGSVFNVDYASWRTLLNSACEYFF